MPPATRHEMREDAEAKGLLQDLIGEQVMHVLGEPVDLVQVQVRSLWMNHYRVNVFTGENVTAARIANSYFLSVDGDGNIVASIPQLAKQY
jgi:hypothetical protein